MKINQRSVLASLGIGLVVAACGGSTSNNPDAGGDSAASSSGSGGSSGGGSSGGSGSGSGGGSGSSSGAGDAAGGPVLTMGTPGMGQVPCGMGPACAAPEACCNTGGGGGGGGAARGMCMSPAACDQAGNDPFTCTGPANCTAPMVCCFRQGITAGGNDQTACETSCTSGPGMPSQVCVANTDCPMGLVCRGGNGAPRGLLMTCRMPPMPMPDGGTPTVEAGLLDATPTVDAGLDVVSTPETGVADGGGG